MKTSSTFKTRASKWLLAVHRQALADLLILHDADFPGDAKSIAMSPYDKNRADIGIGRKVYRPVDAMVAESVGNDQRLLIMNLDKTGWITLR